MKTFPLLFASVLAGVPFIARPALAAPTTKGVTASAQPHPGTKPNIVLIFADDMGYKDTGFTGSDFFETPNLDRLAKQGMVFTSAYAGAANCAPSRACLISGQYTPRHGVYAVGSTNRGPQKQQRLVPIPNKNRLAPDIITIAEALKTGGYATGMFGKWHLGDREGSQPEAQGFDTVFEPMKADDEEDEDKGNATGTPQDPKSVFSITDEVGEFMETNKDRPFFAYVAHHAVHTPYGARPETLAKFQAKAKGKLQGNALYGACVYDFDAAVGQLMQKINDLGLSKKTLVVFTSDNGGVNGRGMSQEPLRGNKGAYYEGGIREPMWAIWPGFIPAGTANDTPVINLDFFPTFLDAAQTPVPTGKNLDGESLLPLFKGQGKLQRPSIFWHFPGYLNKPVNRGRDPLFRTRPVTAMRHGDWKLLLYHEEWQLDGGRRNFATNHAVELYNLANDIGEQHDLANELPAKRDELLDEMLAWIDKTKAPLPSEPNLAYILPQTATTLK